MMIRAMVVGLAIMVAACAPPPQETRSAISGLLIPEGADDIVRASGPGDSNVYDFAYKRTGEDDFLLSLTPTSGPDAVISGGSMEARRDKARASANWFSGSQLCAGRPVDLSNDIFDKPANAWNMRVRCGA